MLLLLATFAHNVSFGGLDALHVFLLALLDNGLAVLKHYKG